jgi:hypothetical protein
LRNEFLTKTKNEMHSSIKIWVDSYTLVYGINRKAMKLRLQELIEWDLPKTQKSEIETQNCLHTWSSKIEALKYLIKKGI